MNGFWILKSIENYNGIPLVHDLKDISNASFESIVLPNTNFWLTLTIYLVDSFEPFDQMEASSVMEEYLFWALFSEANEAKDKLPEELRALAPKSSWK